MNKYCLLLDADPEHARGLADIARDIGFEVLRPATRREAEQQLSATELSVAIIDIQSDAEWQGLALLAHEALESVEIFVMNEDDSPERANEAIRRGASYFFCKPFAADNLRPLLEDIFAEVDPDEDDSQSELPCAVDQFGMLRGSCKGMRKLYRALRKVAPTDASIMIVGESGTGKELVAHTAHLLSKRKDAAYIAFNCAAVPENLAESELFGHEKGSFSGAAKRHRGYFEQASGGTLLLDEVTEMDVDLQAKLLRVLETGRIRRIGSEQEMAVDVRIISATNRSPEQAVRDGRLREDLYYRLAQFPLRVPPLRKRSCDLGGLAQYFLNELNTKHETAIRFSPQALEAIQSFDWPGNVRQLKHAVERAYIMAESSIGPEVVPRSGLRAVSDEDDDAIEVAIGTPLATVERKLIAATLANNDGDKKRTAAELGISLKTLYNRLREYEDSPPAQPGKGPS